MSVFIELELNKIVDKDETIELMDFYDIYHIDTGRLSYVDKNKFELFIEKFESIPEEDLEEFLNKY